MMKYLFVLFLFLPSMVFAAVLDKTALVGKWAVEGYEGFTYQFDADGSVTIDNRNHQTKASFDAVTQHGQGYIVMCTADGWYFFAAADLNVNANRLSIREISQCTGGKIYMNGADKVMILVKTQ